MTERRAADGPVDNAIRATHLLDTIDAAIESLPPDCRPGPTVDPATCPHPQGSRFQFRTVRHWYCEACGTRIREPGR